MTYSSKITYGLIFMVIGLVGVMLFAYTALPSFVFTAGAGVFLLGSAYLVVGAFQSQMAKSKGVTYLPAKKMHQYAVALENLQTKRAELHKQIVDAQTALNSLPFRADGMESGDLLKDRFMLSYPYMTEAEQNRLRDVQERYDRLLLKGREQLGLYGAGIDEATTQKELNKLPQMITEFQNECTAVAAAMDDLVVFCQSRIDVAAEFSGNYYQAVMRLGQYKTALERKIELSRGTVAGEKSLPGLRDMLRRLNLATTSLQTASIAFSSGDAAEAVRLLHEIQAVIAHAQLWAEEDRLAGTPNW